jgi:hypothetical protein
LLELFVYACLSHVAETIYYEGLDSCLSR